MPFLPHQISVPTTASTRDDMDDAVVPGVANGGPAGNPAAQPARVRAYSGSGPPPPTPVQNHGQVSRSCRYRLL